MNYDSLLPNDLGILNIIFQRIKQTAHHTHQKIALGMQDSPEKSFLTYESHSGHFFITWPDCVTSLSSGAKKI